MRRRRFRRAERRWHHIRHRRRPARRRVGPTRWPPSVRQARRSGETTCRDCTTAARAVTCRWRGYQEAVTEEWECAVVGAGAAGLSAALVLGRARRRTLVIDADDQSNRASEVIGGLLGYDRRPPAELYAAGREELKE